MPELESMLTTQELPGRSYDLWKQLLHLVHAAIAQRDWSSVGELLKIYDYAQLAGTRGEMWEASYVAFLEDVGLPLEPADLRKFWQVCPTNFLREIQRDRGIERVG